MDVTIVIVNYNTSRFLSNCIASIKRETKKKYEIIVVDNASSDDSCEMLHLTHQDVFLIKNKINLGFARANNQGFQKARGRYYMMLNPDTVIINQAIDKLVDFMDFHEDVGICGPKNVSPDGSIQIHNDRFPSLLNNVISYFNLKRKIKKLDHNLKKKYSDRSLSEGIDVERIVGCSMIFRSRLYRELHGFDERYFLYFEETDFCYRAKKLGVRITTVPSAEIIHYGGESSKSKKEEPMFDKTLYRYYYQSQYLFYLKNYGIMMMIASRLLDIVYGITLITKNIFRMNKKIKKYKIKKGKTILFNALKIAK